MKGSYVHHKEIQAAQGVKLAAQNLETAVAGTQLHVLHKPEDLEGLKLLAMKDMEDIFKSVDRSGEPQACTITCTLLALRTLSFRLTSLHVSPTWRCTTGMQIWRVAACKCQWHAMSQE